MFFQFSSLFVSSWKLCRWFRMLQDAPVKSGLKKEKLHFAKTRIRHTWCSFCHPLALGYAQTPHTLTFITFFTFPFTFFLLFLILNGGHNKRAIHIHFPACDGISCVCKISSVECTAFLFCRIEGISAPVRDWWVEDVRVFDGKFLSDCTPIPKLYSKIVTQKCVKIIFVKCKLIMVNIKKNNSTRYICSR